MNSKKKDYIGALIIFLGIVGFFFFMQVFSLFESEIEYSNPIYMLKSAIPIIFMLGCGYIGLSIVENKTVPRNIVFYFVASLVVAYIIGLFLHG